MKNKHLNKLAILGITSGMMLANHSVKAEPTPDASVPSLPRQGCGGQSGCGGENDNGNIGYHILSEEELILELNENGEALYRSLDEKGKEFAREVASQRCNGTNSCAGQNACQTESNSCAGKGSCKGRSKCGMSDKNLAVKIAAAKIAKIKAEKAENSSK